MAETRPYEARKTEGADTWEIYNKNSQEVVTLGLPETTAKERASLANELYEEASKEEVPDA